MEKEFEKSGSWCEMSEKRKSRSAEFKGKVALDALKGLKTVNELASEYGVHPVQISQWKKQLQEGVAGIFSKSPTKRAGEAESLKAKLYEEIGRLKIELDWLKKKSDLYGKEWLGVIEPGHCQISIRRQCKLLGVCRSSFYYEPARESETNLVLMRLIDEQYTKTPFYGSRKMTEQLKRSGHMVNRKRVARLMDLMGLQRHRRSIPNPGTAA